MKFQGDCKKEFFVYHYPIRFYVAVKKRETGAREDPTLPLRSTKEVDVLVSLSDDEETE